MAQIYIPEQLAASLQSPRSLDEITNDMTGLATGEALRLLRDFLQTPGAESFLELEERLSQLLSHLSAGLTALAVEMAARTSTFVRRALTSVQQRGDQAGRWRHQGLRETEVRFLGGLSFRFKTPYLTRLRPRCGPKRGVGRRGRSGRGCYPALEVIGIRAGASPGLQSAVARQAARLASFEETRQVFLEQGHRMNVKTVRRITLAVGTKALAQRHARIEASQAGVVFTNELADQRVVVGIDGGRVRLREGGRRGRRRANGRRGFRTPWREPKLMTAYVIDEQGRPVKEVRPFYDATMGDADEAFKLLVAELKVRGVADAKEIIVAADGATWIWNRTEQFASLLGVAQEKITRVVDFYHAVEHLQAIAETRTDWSLSDVRAWVNRHRRRLLQGRINQVIGDAQKLKKRRNRTVIEREIAYFRHLAPFMRYDRFRKRCIPLGSGATESAIRRVVNLRLKGAGIFWKKENAERMLHLRAYLKAGRWNELIRRVIHASPNGQARSTFTYSLHLEAVA